jgi:tetratricopeptide (TPR) repeat protein
MVAASHHIQLGQSAFAAQSYGEALHHFATALNHAPNAPWALHGRGDALQLSGRHQAALEAYKKAIANNDDCGLHHAGAANALAALGRQKDADLAWDSALERDPSLSWMRKGSKNP